MTPRQRAHVELGIRRGDRVAFEFAGVRRIGRIECIKRRATVIAEEPCPSGGGELHRRKFYVPLSLLQRVDE